jgi:hypothetical protein
LDLTGVDSLGGGNCRQSTNVRIFQHTIWRPWRGYAHASRVTTP